MTYLDLCNSWLSGTLKNQEKKESNLFIFLNKKFRRTAIFSVNSAQENDRAYNK